MSNTPGIGLHGTDGDDSLIGTDRDDTITAGAGVDTIVALGGDDLISLNIGNEFADELDCGAGIDTLLVTVLDTNSSYWMPENMYWVGYDAAGSPQGRITVIEGYGMDLVDLALAQPTLKLSTSNGYPGVWIANASLENLSIWTSQRDDSDDMLLVRGTGTYNGYGGFNGLFADWHALDTDIVWNNLGNATVQHIAGSDISNVQRLLVRTGSGNDFLHNTSRVTGDEFETGAGNDTIDAGGGRDRVDAGAGDDVISVLVAQEFEDTVHGGSGSDRLSVTAVIPDSSPWMSKNINFAGYDASWNLLGRATAALATMADADAAMSAPVIKLNTSNGYPGVLFDGIENLSVLANPEDDSDDMLCVIGTGTYNAYGGFDALYANWGAAVNDIRWVNLASAVQQQVNGSSISNVERLLVRTGSGDDDLRNTAVSTDDEFETGAGNDTIYAGGGRDRVDAGSGNDLVSVLIGSEFEDTVHGGTGTDTLMVAAVIPGSSPWMSKNMYFVGYNADWSVTGRAYPGSATLADGDAVLTAPILKLNTSNGYPGVLLDGFENLSITANPEADSNDMLLVIGTGIYDGAGGTDTLYANWSSSSSDIRWDNLASAVTQTVNGSTLSNIERLLLRTGSGNDDLRNTALASDDEFETGAGNDTVWAGTGSDRVDLGAGQDEAHVVFAATYEGADVVSGGSGTDKLFVDAGATTVGGLYWHAYGPAGTITRNAGAADSMATIASLLSAPTSLQVQAWNSGSGVIFSSIEEVSLSGSTAAAKDDLLIAVGNGTLAGNGGTDTFYADWSASGSPIVWANNAGGAAQSVNGLAISGVERLLLRTGSGADDLRNTVAATNDEFETGSGNDLVQAGAGNDRVFPGTGNDTVDGGTGTDTVVFAGVRSAYAVTRNAAATTFVVTSTAEGTDRISNVESFQFSDTTVAASSFAIDSTAPAVAAFAPADEAVGVALNANLILSFSEPVERGSGTLLLKTTAGATVASYDVASSPNLTLTGTTLTLNPDADLSWGMGYRLELPAGSFVDAVGNPNVLLNSYNFTAVEQGRLLTGTPGADLLQGGTGNDTIDGGTGIDRVTFSGNRSQYSLTHAGTRYSVADHTLGRDGTDSLANVEALRFNDMSVDLTMPQLASTVPAATLKTLEELYVGFFNRVPEAAGLGYWIGQIKAGVSLASIANQFYDAGVIFGNYPSSMTNPQFIREIYKNVLGRPPGVVPTDAEVGYWDNLLVRGTYTKGTMVLQMLSDVHTYFEGITDPTNPNYPYQFVAAHLNNKAAVANWYAVQQGLSLNVQVDNIAFGQQMAALITPTDVTAAIALVGLSDGFVNA